MFDMFTLRHFPGHGVFATAAADDKNFHCTNAKGQAVCVTEIYSGPFKMIIRAVRVVSKLQERNVHEYEVRGFRESQFICKYMKTAETRATT
jgi:hypothetical protein